ncbi:MAG: response regulator transcription factor [Atopobiaceae bacterium]|nr:response regulator transcription factor [Atopobiaceae bacterium]
MNVLIVEDERNLADALCQIVGDAGYNAEAVHTGDDGLVYAESGLYDAVILDVMLPGKDGFEVVHELRRKRNNVPVLMLTARTDTADKVSGLDSGADDYMTKPFESAELLARLRALTRRSGEVMLDKLSFGDIELDLTTHDLSCNGRPVHLSNKEFDVMRMLMSGSNRIVSKQELLTSVWGALGEATENSAEAYVSFLRRKLAHIGSNVRIATLRMLGYRLEEGLTQ